MKSNKSAKPQSKLTKSEVIHEQTDEELEDNIEEQDDDKMNDELFEMYDTMFKNFNDFGAMFQKTAHYIGMLIRKNMTLNQKIESYEEQFDKFVQINNRNEEAYENLLKSLAEKDRQIEDLLGENTGLKLQMEQFLIKKPQQPVQRDILKEREEAAKKSSSTSTSSNKKLMAQQQKQAPQPTKNSNLVPGTFESFFDFEKPPANQDPDTCSLRDLFSLKNSKKRPEFQYEHEELKQEQWMTNNKKKLKKSYKEDKQIAERFDQLSQAFFNVGNSNNSSFKGRESIESMMQRADYQEDSGSSSSVINAGIRFDAQQAKDHLVQSKLNFNKSAQKQGSGKQDKNYEIEVVEQVSESLVDDFFSIKNEKKDRASAQSNAKSVGSNRQKSARGK